MKSDKETRDRLIESAKSEFLENGYMKASLRKICAGAGVTTGALYFFFKDKEDLFAAIVEPVLNSLIAIIQQHFTEDEEYVATTQVTLDDERQNKAHYEFETQLVHFLYSQYDEVILLLKKSQGSRFEGCIDRLVGLVETSYLSMTKKMKLLNPRMKINEYMNSWLTHMSIDAFVYLVLNEPDEQKALEHMELIMWCILRDWMEMLLISEE